MRFEEFSDGIRKLLRLCSRRCHPIKGNRIDIEIVLEDYLEGASPEEILLRYPTLNLKKYTQLSSTI